MPRFAVIGDVHRLFDALDAELLDAQSYDAILFVGDLAGYTKRGGLDVARAIARLRTRTLVIPGNHDGAHGFQMAAEILEADPLLPLVHLGQRGRDDELARALAPAVLTGYSVHPLAFEAARIDVIAARPHSAGGDRVWFRPYLRDAFGVETLEDSARRLIELVDRTTAPDLIFLAHNGPTGLGARRDDPWGCDFKREEGDFGDADLRAAIDHARSIGKNVRAVVAGHMHHRLRGGGERRWRVEVDGVLYVNAARVPRIFRRGERWLRHHVELIVDADRVVARERLIETPHAQSTQSRAPSDDRTTD